MKILVVQETDWIKRGPHQQHHLFERLSLRGHEIRVIDIDYLWRQDKGPLFAKSKTFTGVSKYYEGAKVDVIRPPIIRFPVLDMVSIVLYHPGIIEKQIRDWKPDIVVGFGILNTYYARKIAEKHNVPFIYYLIDSLHTLLENDLLESIAQYFEKKTLQKTSHVLTINQGLKSYAISMGADENFVNVIPAGIDLEKYQNRPREEMRNKLNISVDSIVLFFMGWLYSFSGILEVAESIIESNEPKFVLLVVGEGDQFESLKKLSEKNPNIILTGRAPYQEIPDLLSCADICLLPAYQNKIMQDIVPIKIYEYMAAGKPIIATRLNGLVQEFGENSGLSYIDDPSEVIMMVQNIEKNNLISRLESEAFKTVLDKDWNCIVNIFENYLLNIG